MDIACIAAPAVDAMGNISGIHCPAACGSLGYAMPDADCASRHRITDHRSTKPLERASIAHDRVSHIVYMDSMPHDAHPEYHKRNERSSAPASRFLGRFRVAQCTARSIKTVS